MPIVSAQIAPKPAPDQAPQPAPPVTPNQRMVAIGLVCGAVLGFTVIDVCGKYLVRAVGPVEATFLRYLSGFIWILPFLNPWRVPDLLRSERPWTQFARALLLLASTALNFIALLYLQLAQTVSIMFLAPLIVSLMAGPLLGEWVGPRRLAAIGVGFLGVLIITRPGLGVVHPAVIFSVLGMLCYSTILLMTRRLSARDSAETTMFYSSLFGAVALAPFALAGWQPLPDLWHWVVVVIMGFGGAAGHWLLIQAQRATDAPVLAPFLYTQVIWMTAGGYFFYGEFPDFWTLVGMAVVVASGLYLLHRERVRAMEARRTAKIAVDSRQKS